MMMRMSHGKRNGSFVAYLLAGLVFLGGVTLVGGAVLNGSFATVPAASVVNLTTEGRIDWVHWGLSSETSLDRKAGVEPQISDFIPVDASNGFVFVYQFADNANGYSWSDGTPTASVTNSTTGVWAYGTPLIGSGFQISALADTATRTLKVYVGAFKARGQLEASLSDGSASAYINSSLFNTANGPSGVYTSFLSLNWALNNRILLDKVLNDHVTVQELLCYNQSKTYVQALVWPKHVTQSL